MLLDNFAETDINRLPYFVTNTATGERQNVYFASLLPEDEPQLRGPDWSRAVYRDVWPVYVFDPQTYKLLCEDNPSGEILGLVHIGIVLSPRKYLRKSLLESAPSNQTRAQSRKFAGVGRVLVARLVAESYRAGEEGRLVVKPRTGSEKFYGKLGFQKGKSGEMLLETEGAADLLASVLRERQEEENGQ